MKRSPLPAVLAAAAALLLPAPAQAIVGGEDVPAGEHPYVAEIYLGYLFGCTGTLIDPTHVVTAGHCSSLTGGTGVVSSPIEWPAQSIEVYLGSNKPLEGRLVPVKSVEVHESYLGLLENRYDLSLLTLAEPVTDLPSVKVAADGERDLWKAGTLADIVGWGVTESGGSSPDTLQKAQVPITTDPACNEPYEGTFDPATMVCAGFPEGGVDTCQGDSGGPLMVPAPDGSRRLAGATSFGQGCAEPGYPGVYARVADDVLREWIRARAPQGVAPEPTTSAPAPDSPAGKGKKPKSGSKAVRTSLLR